MEHIAELLDLTPAEVLGTASFYDMSSPSRSGATSFGVHQHRLPAQRRLRAAGARRGAARRAAGGTTDDGRSRSRRSSASPLRRRPVPGRQLALLRQRHAPTPSTSWSTTCVPGKLDDEVPPHGTLSRVRRERRPHRRAGPVPTPTRADVTVTDVDAHRHRPDGHATTPATLAYLATGGYEGLRKALTMTPEDVAEEVKTASLLGRGGAGFPAGTKWTILHEGAPPRYLVVNGDESEPGTFKDHMLLERDPHQLIEGALICRLRHRVRPRPSSTCGARSPSAWSACSRPQRGVRRTAPSAATSSAPASPSTSSLHRAPAPTSCGEETALLESLEGKRGFPRIKPPYFPAAIGLYVQPTIVNNVETLSQPAVDRHERRRRLRRARRRPVDRHAALLRVRPRAAARATTRSRW